jgi:sulfur relay protein TusB/DsrH
MKKTLVLMSDKDVKGLQIASGAADGDIAVCFMQDAVYLAAKGKKLCDTLISQKKKVYAITKDVQLRGLNKDLIYSEVQLIDYPAVIDLVLEYENIINY